MGNKRGGALGARGGSATNVAKGTPAKAGIPGQGPVGMPGGAPNAGVGGHGGGAGGGQATKSKGTGTASANTGGVTGGGGGGKSKGGGGGSSSDAAKAAEKQTTVDKQPIPPDANLKELFEDSDVYEELADKYPGDRDLNRHYNVYFERWAKSVDIKQIDLKFSDTVSDEVKAAKNAQLAKIPLHVRRRLEDRGLKLHVGNRADDTDGWAAFAAATGATSTTLTKDGREFGNVSFHSPTENVIFISTGNPGGSRNVIAHEASHSVDARWLKNPIQVPWETGGSKSSHTVDVISRDDPEFVALHDTHILLNADFWGYFRVGSRNTPESGRSEFFAESLASYYEGGIVGLRGFLAEVADQTERNLVADTLISIWNRYKLLEG